MIKLHLSHHAGYTWQAIPLGDRTLHYKGNEWESGTALRHWCAEGNHDEASLLRCLAELPFTFAVVVTGQGDLCAAVDQLRTHPLFYQYDGGVLRVTDDPYAPAAAFDTRLDAPLCAAEFLLSGYVTGDNTLSSAVKGLQAGEFLRAVDSPEGPEYAVKRYQPPIQESPLAEDANTGARLMALCDSIFAELCASLRGRQVVLPLSSGVDSRFIAAMLKRHGHERVLTYTYGRPGNWEVNDSRQTAQRLGFSWHFVPYSRRQWRQWYQSADMAEYRPFCSRHVSTPHIQDWPAVLELKRKGLIDANAVFVPGHTCMLTSANRLDRSIARLPDSQRSAAMAESLFKHHFTLQRARRVTPDAAAIKQRLCNGLPPNPDRDIHSLLNAYFNFEATERAAKLIINSVRVYEFFGYQWALPLWDRRLTRWWAQVPFEGRYGKRAFREFLQQTNLYSLFPAPGAPGLFARLRETAKDNPLTYAPLKRLKCAEERCFGYCHHFLDWYGIVTYPQYVYHMGRCGNIYSILSRLYLQAVVARR